MAAGRHSLPCCARVLQCTAAPGRGEQQRSRAQRVLPTGCPLPGKNVHPKMKTELFSFSLRCQITSFEMPPGRQEMEYTFKYNSLLFGVPRSCTCPIKSTYVNSKPLQQNLTLFTPNDKGSHASRLDVVPYLGDISLPLAKAFPSLLFWRSTRESLRNP